MLRGTDDDMSMDVDEDKPQPETQPRIVPTKVRGVNGTTGPGRNDFSGGTGLSDGAKSNPPNSWIPGGQYGSSGNDDDDDDDDEDPDPFAEVGFTSVAGLDDQIMWLTQNIVNPLKDKKLAELWGLEPVKGVLFHGPPGTGKTLLARAFGNEVSQLLGKRVTFYHRRGGDLFSKWFGGSANLIKALFEDAKAHSPSIIFLDELDGICPTRDGAGSHQAIISVVSSLLAEMDAVVPGSVFVFGATNRVDAVDPAMRRPGRFDKHLAFFLPTLNTRKNIITIHSQHWKQSHPRGEDLEQIAQKTVGFTGADLENLVRETFFTAFRRHVPDLDAEPGAGIGDMEITLEDWTSTLDRVKASSGTSYGSALYIPKLPNGLLNPLIGPIQDQIVEQMIPLFPGNSSASTAINGFFLWDPTPKNSSVYGLEFLILPSVFGHETISNYPVFMLDVEKLQSVYASHRVVIMAEVILQAASSSKPCILYLPQLESMLKSLSDGDIFNLYDQLTHLRGKHVLLLASGVVAPGAISNPEIRSIFSQRFFSIPKNTEEERLSFFEPLFNSLKQKWTSKTTKTELDEMLKSVVERTNGDAVEVMANLHGRISNTMNKFEDEKEFLTAMQQLLTMYSKTKLGI